jgi:hypothetical protein
MVAVQAKSGTLSIYVEHLQRESDQYRLDDTISTSTSQWEDAYLGEAAYSRASGLIYADVATSVAPSLFAPG